MLKRSPFLAHLKLALVYAQGGSLAPPLFTQCTYSPPSIPLGASVEYAVSTLTLSCRFSVPEEGGKHVTLLPAQGPRVRVCVLPLRNGKQLLPLPPGSFPETCAFVFEQNEPASGFWTSHFKSRRLYQPPPFLTGQKR